MSLHEHERDHRHEPTKHRDRAHGERIRSLAP
jgi:hypothetical protein